MLMFVHILGKCKLLGTIENNRLLNIYRWDPKQLLSSQTVSTFIKIITECLLTEIYREFSDISTNMKEKFIEISIDGILDLQLSSQSTENERRKDTSYFYNICICAPSLPFIYPNKTEAINRLKLENCICIEWKASNYTKLGRTAEVTSVHYLLFILLFIIFQIRKKC